MSSRDKIQTVIHDPSSFYLNVHSSERLDGSIRALRLGPALCSIVGFDERILDAARRHGVASRTSSEQLPEQRMNRRCYPHLA